jgi:hypothetical protein
LRQNHSVVALAAVAVDSIHSSLDAVVLAPLASVEWAAWVALVDLDAAVVTQLYVHLPMTTPTQ